MSAPVRKERIAKVRRKGFADGTASAFRVTGSGRLAPPKVRRDSGSLRSDMREIKRDGDRLFRGD